MTWSRLFGVWEQSCWPRAVREQVGIWIKQGVPTLPAPGREAQKTLQTPALGKQGVVTAAHQDPRAGGLGAGCVKAPGPSYPLPWGVPAREACWCVLHQPLSPGAPAPSSPQCSPGVRRGGGAGQWGSLAWSSPSGVWRHGGCSSYSSSSGYKQAAERATRCLEVGQVSGGGTGVQVWPSARSRTGS